MTKVHHVEVTGRVFTGPRPNNSLSADFQRPSERVNFCLLEPIEVPYYALDGLSNIVVANKAAEILGPGFYGAKSWAEPF